MGWVMENPNPYKPTAPSGAEMCRCLECGEVAVGLVRRRRFKVKEAVCQACGKNWKEEIEVMEGRFG